VATRRERLTQPRCCDNRRGPPRRPQGDGHRARHHRGRAGDGVHPAVGRWRPAHHPSTAPLRPRTFEVHPHPPARAWSGPRQDADGRHGWKRSARHRAAAASGTPGGVVADAPEQPPGERERLRPEEGVEPTGGRRGSRGDARSVRAARADGEPASVSVARGPHSCRPSCRDRSLRDPPPRRGGRSVGRHPPPGAAWSPRPSGSSIRLRLPGSRTGPPGSLCRRCVVSCAPSPPRGAPPRSVVGCGRPRRRHPGVHPCRRCLRSRCRCR
jgi:hypothetical protein